MQRCGTSYWTISDAALSFVSLFHYYSLGGDTVCLCVCTVPPRVLLDSANQAVSLSERVLLDCPVSDADPAPVILWTKNDQPLTLGGRLQQLPNGSLAIYDSAVRTT